MNLNLRDLHRKKTGRNVSAPPRTTGAERQRVMEENTRKAEAAQKIVDDQKEKARLEEENKKLKAQLEKAQNVPDPVPESPRPKSDKKGRLSNLVCRVKAVNFTPTCSSFRNFNLTLS